MIIASKVVSVRRRVNRGFTLVELMIVVAVIGILAALAIYGVRKYLNASKAAEAKQSVGQISRNATSAFERERAPSQAVTEGGESDAVSHELCGTATPVPETIPVGKKYQPQTADGTDWDVGDAVDGWPCLRFLIDQPIYYQYLYNKDASVAAPDSDAACDTDCYEAGALGDLNGNGLPSRFARTGHINTSTGTLKASTHVYVESEEE